MAACLLFTCSLYFLVENGSANSFTTYLLAVSAIWLFVNRPGTINLYDGPLTALVTGLLLYLAISVIWSGGDESALKQIAFALLVLTFCLSIGYSIEHYPRYLYWLVLFIVLAAAINSGYSLYLHYAMPDYQPLPEPRLFALGRLSNPVISALSYGFATLLCVFFVLTNKRLTSKILFAVIIVLFLGCIVLSGSRGVWPALLVGATAGILVHYEGHRKFQMIGITIAIIAVAGGALTLGLDAMLERALSFRPEIWAEFTRRTLDTNLLLGVGMTADSTFQHPSQLIKHPHSIFIATFYYGGMIGLLLLIAMLGRAVWLIVLMPHGEIKTLAAMLLAFGVTATLVDGDEVLTKVNYLWLLIWLPVGLSLYVKDGVKGDVKNRF